MTERNPQVVREFKERQKKQLWLTVPVIFVKLRGVPPWNALEVARGLLELE